MGEKVIGRKAYCCFFLHLGDGCAFCLDNSNTSPSQFPNPLSTSEADSLSISSPGSFSADGPSGPRQEGPRTTGCSPQRCNSCTEIRFYHSQDFYKFAAPANNYFLITEKTSTKLDRVPVSVSEWLLGSFVLILRRVP